VSNKNIITIDSYDPVIYTGVKEASGKLQQLVPDENLDGLVSDVFYSLYKSSPTIKDEAQGLTKSLVETMMQSTEYQSLRAATRFDEISSALGTLELAPTMVEHFEKVEKEMKKEGKDPSGEDGIPSQDQSDAIRRAMKRATKMANEKVEEWHDAIGVWGIKPGDLQNLSTEGKLELAEKLIKSSKLKAISEIAGRLKNIALSAVAMSPSHGVDEIVDVGFGGDISRMLPNEVSKLHRNKALFMKDLHERSLLNYNLRGVDNLGYGPIVVCLDISGSMQGKREIWAKAVILALITIAEKQNRPFGVIAFDTHARKTWFSSKMSLTEKLEIAAIRCDGGGTDFYNPLLSAFELRNSSLNLKPADIVFITDGECELNDKQLKHIDTLKKDTSVRIHGVAISDNSHKECSSGKTLTSFSDNLCSVNNLGEVEAIKGVFIKAATLTTR